MSTADHLGPNSASSWQDDLSDERSMNSIYLSSLHKWRARKALSTRISSRLSRYIPATLCSLKNTKPIVTFTFDDFPESALAYGAHVLEQSGARGSFYVSTALLGRDMEHWKVTSTAGVHELHHKNHEIGLHGHVHLPIGIHSAQGLKDDLARNNEILKTIDAGILADNFAYPYGQVNFARKFQLKNLVRSSRTTLSGINCNVIDPQFIRAVLLENASIDHALIDAWLDKAVELNGWLVFVIHDISETPSPFGVSNSLFQYALEGSIRRGLEILTMRMALDASQVRCR